jgi:hypothetical protein
MLKEEILFDAIGQKLEGADKSQLFGTPCYKIGKKAFVCFFQNEMVFKLNGDSHSDALSLDGAQLFDPSGKKRPMKEWVQVPFDYSDNWTEYAKSAMEYVAGK